MKVWIDREQCTGCGNCAERAPKVFTKVSGLGFVVGVGGTPLWNELGTTNVGVA